MTAIASNSQTFGLASLKDRDESAPLRFEARRSRIAMAGILIAVSSTISSSLVYTAKADREINAQYAASISAYTTASHRVQRALDLETREQQTALQITAAAAIPRQALRSVALAVVVKSLPPDMALRSLTIEPARDRSTVHITGTTGSGESLAMFERKLGEAGLFREITAVNPNRPGEFELLAVLKDDEMDRPGTNGAGDVRQSASAGNE